jgi:hypothetical protein
MEPSISGPETILYGELETKGFGLIWSGPVTRSQALTAYK